MEFVFNKLDSLLNVNAIVAILYQKLETDFIFEGESHDFWEFIYVDIGEIIVTCGNFKYTLKKGEVSLHKPNEFHSVMSNNKDKANIITVSFVCTDEIMKSFEDKILFLNNYERKLLFDIVEETKLCFVSTTDRIPYVGMQRLENAPTGSMQIIKIMVEVLLLRLSRHKNSMDLLSRKIFLNKHNNDILLCNCIFDYLKSNIQKRITLSDISKDMNLNPSTIKRIFRELYGIGVICYFNNMKIQQAKEYIEKTGLNFTQIADKLGFDNLQYFSMVFKKKTNMTPSEYAKERGNREETQETVVFLY